MTSSVGSTGSTGNTGSTSGTSGSSQPTSAAAILAAAKTAAQAAAQTIISGSGIGSGMNLASLMSGLMSVESVPLLQLQAQEATVDAQVSAFGTISSAFSTFEDAISNLTFASSFETLAAGSSDETVASAAVTAGAAAGSYTVNVTQLAQAESVLTTGMTSTSTPIGSGATTTLNITFGTTTTTGTPPNTTTSFSANAGQTVIPITIDSSDNTLDGIRAAINAAFASDTTGGVTATIVNDGSGQPYRLAITSKETGVTQSVSISVAGANGTGTGDSAIANMFTYNPGGTENMTQTSAAQNAQLTVNSTPISSTSNTVNGQFPGLSIALIGQGTTTITVGNATNSLEGLVDSFVTAYNNLQATIQPLSKFDDTDPDDNGALIGNSTVQQLTSHIQSIVSSVVGGASTFTQLADIGITLDPTTGQLDLDSSTLESALSTNASAFQALFAVQETASDPLVTAGVASSGTPQSGTYNVNISQAATQGILTGTATPTPPTASTQLSVNLNGTFASITVPAGSYATMSDYATALQAAINGNSAFTAADPPASATVSVNAAGNLVIQSNQYGSSSNITVTGTDAQTLFGSASNTGTAGVDVEGTIGGYPASGSGQTLTASGSTPVAGLTATVLGNQTGARGTISYSSGIAEQLTDAMNDALADTNSGAAANGAITTAVKTLKDQISQLQTQESSQQDYINSVSANYAAEFTALQTTLSAMSNIKSYLQQIFNPSTSS